MTKTGVGVAKTGVGVTKTGVGVTKTGVGVTTTGVGVTTTGVFQQIHPTVDDVFGVFFFVYSIGDFL
jgi:hypothetical protein